MTRRILLTLDESVTETECGDCTYSSLHPVDGEWSCSRPEFERSCRMPRTEPGKRLPECLAAEQAAERCVLATIRDVLPTDAAHEAEVDAMIEQAHAAKARGGAK